MKNEVNFTGENHELREYDMEVDVCNPWANPDEVQHEYRIKT